MHQVHQALYAWLMGLLAGLYYDFLKTLRRRIRRRGVTRVLDLLFWMGLALALFVQTLTMGDGEVRIFMLVTNGLGALLYFLVLSGLVLFLLGKGLDILMKIARLIVRPARAIWAKGRSFVKVCKEGFKNWVKYYIIRHIHKIRVRNCAQKRMEAKQVETQKGRYLYETSGAAAGRVRGIQPDGSPRTDRERKRDPSRFGRGRK